MALLFLSFDSFWSQVIPWPLGTSTIPENEHMKYWNENPEEAANKWGIHKWVALRNSDVDGQIAKFVSPQVNFEWKVALTYSYELEDGDDFKKNSVKMATEFEKFARQCSSVSFIYG